MWASRSEWDSLKNHLKYLEQRINDERDKRWTLEEQVRQLAEELGKKFVQRPAMTVLVDIPKDKNAI